MTNEQIRQQIVDMIPFAHMERFETLWTMLTPKYERLLIGSFSIIFFVY